MDQELLVLLSVVGPIGVPASTKPRTHQIATADGKPMNAMHDYVVRMDADVIAAGERVLVAHALRPTRGDSSSPMIR